MIKRGICIMNGKKILLALVFAVFIFVSGCNKNTNSDTGNIVVTNPNKEQRTDLGTLAETFESMYEEGDLLIKDICYEINEGEKTATIIGHNNPTGKINIPEAIDGYKITAIDEYAFYEAELTEIILPDTIETIGSAAFYKCSNLENISLPNSLFSIDSFAFAECTSLKSIDIPTSTQNIDNFAFINCSNLSNVKIELKNTFAQTAFLNCPGSPIKYDGNFKDASLNRHTTEIPAGYTYSDWITESSFESEEPMELGGDDTSRTLSDGYYIVFDEENMAKMIYKYIIQKRDKEPKFIEQQVTTYDYTISIEENGSIIDKEYYNQSSIPSEAYIL